MEVRREHLPAFSDDNCSSDSSLPYGSWFRVRAFRAACARRAAIKKKRGYIGLDVGLGERLV